MKHLFSTLAILFLIIAAQATTFEEESYAKASTGISGRILDSDQLALPGATIYIRSIHTGTVSDVNGFFHINVKPGQYKVEISYIGFLKQEIETTVIENKMATLNITLNEGVEMSEIVVTQSLKGQSKAFNMQRSNKNISNIISADQVGRFPDANIGDAMKRIPGINVQYDQGEARFGHIRGMSPEMNSVTINGERMPSAEAEIRGNQLDLIPSDMVQTVEVSKVVTPDMDADAIGGSVNLVTKTNPHGRRISGNVGSGYNVLSGKPMLNLNLLYGERLFNNTLGLILSGSYFDHQLGSHNIEAEWDEAEQGYYTSDFQVRTYNVQRIRQSYSASLDYSPNANNTIELKAIYNHRNDWENRFRLRYKNIELSDDEEYIADIYRETKGGHSDNKNARLEDQRVMAYSLLGNHHVGKVKLTWKVSYDKASEERPNERYISMKAGDVEIEPNFGNTEFPSISVTNSSADLSSDYGLKEITEEHQSTQENNFTGKFDVTVPFVSGKYSNRLKIGAKYKAKEKSRTNDFYEYAPTDEDELTQTALSETRDITDKNFRVGNYSAGTFVDEAFLGSLQLENTSEFEKEQVIEEIAGNFQGTEDILAAYLRFDQNIGKNIELVAGLRAENTQTSFSGYNFSVDEDGDGTLSKSELATNSYTNILPSIIGKYSISDQTKLKFGWTNTIARPKFIYITPYTQINLEDLEKSIGNPELEAARSMNLDLMVENYFKTIGIVSGGVFYKNIKDFAVEKEMRDVVEGSYTWEKLYEPINGNALVFGAEIAVQRQFDFLPGALKQLGVYANYTYTHSEVTEIALEGREDDELTLPGTPEHNLNTSIFYEGSKFTARLSLNTASAFLDEVGKSTMYDSWYDQEMHLDVNASYIISEHWIVYADATNLLDTPLRYYQGCSEYTKQTEYYGPKFKIGARFNF